jgi:hypothetical protein
MLRTANKSLFAISRAALCANLPEVNSVTAFRPENCETFSELQSLSERKQSVAAVILTKPDVR